MSGQTAFPAQAIIQVPQDRAIARVSSGTGSAEIVTFDALMDAILAQLPTSEPVATGTAWLDGGVLKRAAGIPPAISSQPSSTEVEVGATATFSVTASNVETYQWQVDTGGGFANISGATSSSYTTPVTTGDDDGKVYRCVLTGPGGTTNSNSATLSVETFGVGADFVDRFERSDTSPSASPGSVGNSWVDVAGNTYSISSNELATTGYTWEDTLKRAVAGMDWEAGPVRLLFDLPAGASETAGLVLGYKQSRGTEYGGIVFEAAKNGGFYNVRTRLLYSTSTFFNGSVMSFQRRSAHRYRVACDWDGANPRMWVYDIADPDNPIVMGESTKAKGSANLTALDWDTIAFATANNISQVAIYDAQLEPAWSYDSVAYDNAAIYYSPHNWDDTGTVRRTVNPGAYIKLQFTGTRFAVEVTPTSWSRENELAWQVDGGSIQRHEIPANIGYMDLAQGLDDTTHSITIWFQEVRSYSQDRWSLSNDNGIEVAGFRIDSGKAVSAPATTHNATALFLGDSITEAAVDADDNRANKSWAAQLADLRSWEHGQVGFSYQGWTYMLAGTNVPDGEASWDLFYDGASKLSGGLFVDEPDNLLLNWGENDATLGSNDPVAVEASAENVLAAIRAAAPNANIFLVVPFTGAMRSAVTDAFNDYQSASPDANCYLIDTGYTSAADYDNSDGKHPSTVGAAQVATDVDAAIDTALGI